MNPGPREYVGPGIPNGMVGWDASGSPGKSQVIPGLRGHVGPGISMVWWAGMPGEVLGGPR